MSISSRVNDWRSSTSFVTIVVCYAVFVDQVFFAFILPILPYSLPEINHVSDHRVQFWTTIEIVVFGIACLLSCPAIGWWTDRGTTRKGPFIAGLAILLTSTLIMWLAHAIPFQIFSRVLQGVSDAVIYVVGMAIIVDAVSTKHVAEYMGHVAIAMNLGTFAGPLLGGVVLQAGGYHAVWSMMLGFVVVDCILRIVMVERSNTDQGISDVEIVTAAQSTLGLPTQKHIILEDHHVLATLSTYSEKTSAGTRSSIPDILRLLGSVRMITACFGVCVQSMVFSGFETVLAKYVQDIWKYNALGSGLIFIPLTIAAFFAPFIGRIADRTSTRWALVAGFLGMCPVIILARFITYNSIGQKVLLCFFLVLIGLGVNVTLGPLMAEISHIAEEFVEKQSASPQGKSAYAQAFALNAMAWSCGNIAGPLLCGMLKDHAGWGLMCCILGLVSGFAAIPCFIWSGRPAGSPIWNHDGWQTFR